MRIDTPNDIFILHFSERYSFIVVYSCAPSIWLPRPIFDFDYSLV